MEGAPDLAPEDKALLTLAQASFPLVQRPFAALAGEVGLSEEAVIARMTALKASGLIRKIAPVFEPARLGLTTELVAAEVAPPDLEAAGAAVAAWPPVTHCYAREHRVNLWFTGAACGEAWFACAAARAATLPGVCGVWRLPAVRRFKIAVHFDLMAGPDPPAGRTCPSPSETPAPPPPRWSGSDLSLLRAVEADLPLCPEPFAALASSLAMAPEDLLGNLRQWVADGRIRRYGALVNHRRLGFVANAMTVWAVPDDRLETVGRCLATSPSVSHCYQRPAFPDFPHNLYAMVHAQSRARCLDLIRELSRKCGAGDPVPLFSTREFKKTAPRYSELLTSCPLL